MDTVKSQLDKLLEEMEALPENRQETALAVVNPKPSLQTKSQNASSVNDWSAGKPKIKDDPHQQNQLTDLLNQTYTMLKKYGEAADATAMREAGFQMMLGDYPIEDVQAAFKTYLKTGKEIPTPADIIEILDPSVRPLCPRVYQRFVNLSKEGPFALTASEREYIYQYEQQQLGRIP